MMYPYAVGSVFVFLCMIIGVLFGQLFGGSNDPTPKQEELLDEPLTDEEQEILEEISNNLNVKSDDLKED